MNFPRAIVSILGFVALALEGPLPAQSSGDPCSFDGGVAEYLEALGDQGVAGEDVTPESLRKGALRGFTAATAAEVHNRPSGDGVGGGILDSYQKFFLALQVGTVSEEGDALVFNLRPDLLDFAEMGEGSLRALVRKPQLFGPLSEAFDALPENTGSDRKGEIESEFTDTDDVEYQFRWQFGGGASNSISEQLAQEIFEASYSTDVQPAQAEAARKLLDVKVRMDALLRGGGARAVSAVCKNSEFLNLRGEYTSILTEIGKNMRALKANLDKLGYENIGDLIEGQPTFALDLMRRERAREAGPAVTSARLLFQMGSRSLSSFKRWAKRNGKDFGAKDFGEYLTRPGASPDSRSYLTLSADYSETERFGFALPEDGLSLDLPKSKVISASLAVGHKLSKERRSHIDLDARYENATGDPNRNNRFVSTLSWTQKLSDQLATMAGGSNLVVSVVYANRPEYRGDVDKELSLRAGLKWSVDTDKKSSE